MIQNILSSNLVLFSILRENTFDPKRFGSHLQKFGNAKNNCLLFDLIGDRNVLNLAKVWWLLEQEKLQTMEYS